MARRRSPRTDPTGRETSRGPARRLERGFVDRNFYPLISLPAVLLVTAVTVVPLAMGIYLSFTDYRPTRPSFDWVGIRNYQKMMADPAIPTVVGNTVLFVAAALVVETVLGLMVASLLDRVMRGITFWRVVYILPLAVSAVASAVAWKSLFNTSSGWVNYFLSLMRMPEVNWLSDPHTAMATVVVADAWSGVPMVAIVVLGGLLQRARDPEEAARVDGASEFQIFRALTLPAIAPVLGFAMLLRLFDLFRQIGLFQLMTGGGPGLATNVLNLYVFQKTFQFGELGYGAALGVLLTLIMVVFGVLVFLLLQWTTGRWSHSRPEPRRGAADA